MAAETSSEVAVITHWGFIRAVTGLKVPNGTVLRIDPAQPDRGVQQISCPDPC
jgi:hypothetical protein